MHLWFERKISESADAHICQAERRMIDQDVAPALCAITAVADVAALKSAKEFRAFSNIYVFLFPQCDRAHRRSGITPAVLAMAVTHLQGFAAHLDLYGSTVTSACMCLWHEKDINQESRNRGKGFSNQAEGSPWREIRTIRMWKQKPGKINQESRNAGKLVRVPAAPKVENTFSYLPELLIHYSWVETQSLPSLLRCYPSQLYLLSRKSLSSIPAFLIQFLFSCLAEGFHGGDRPANDATYYAADRVPAAHSQTAKCATGDAEQDITHRML